MNSRNRKIFFAGLLFLLVLAAVLAWMIFSVERQQLRIVFLDVGQGDAILIEKGDQQILIDGGPSGDVLLNKLGQYMPFWDRTIETVIVTHPDQDHLGGIIKAIETYRIGALIDNGEKSDTQLYKKYQELVWQNQLTEITARRGMKIKLGEVVLEILSPDGATPGVEKDSNLASVVARLAFGQSSFLFTGDLPFAGETKLLDDKIDLSAQVLKVAHHGSKYSTSTQFLDAVNSRDAVISVGQNNRYGHPAMEALERLKNKGINIFRTDERGDIEYDCLVATQECLGN